MPSARLQIMSNLDNKRRVIKAGCACAILDEAKAHHAVQPPSTVRQVPVTNDEAGLAR